MIENIDFIRREETPNSLDDIAKKIRDSNDTSIAIGIAQEIEADLGEVLEKPSEEEILIPEADTTASGQSLLEQVKDDMDGNAR